MGFQEDARKQYEMAHHLLNVTFPSIQDPKIFIGVLHSIHDSLENSAKAFLKSHKVPNYNIQLLRQCIKEQGISQKYVNLMNDLRKIVELHKRSPIEFRRRGAFILCSKEYEIKTITLHDLSEHLNTAGKFISIIEEGINRK